MADGKVILIGKLEVDFHAKGFMGTKRDYGWLCNEGTASTTGLPGQFDWHFVRYSFKPDDQTERPLLRGIQGTPMDDMFFTNYLATLLGLPGGWKQTSGGGNGVPGIGMWDWYRTTTTNCYSFAYNAIEQYKNQKDQSGTTAFLSDGTFKWVTDVENEFKIYVPTLNPGMGPVFTRDGNWVKPTSGPRSRGH
jgi:hypothetical protein